MPWSSISQPGHDATRVLPPKRTLRGGAVLLCARLRYAAKRHERYKTLFGQDFAPLALLCRHPVPFYAFSIPWTSQRDVRQRV